MLRGREGGKEGGREGGEEGEDDDGEWSSAERKQAKFVDDVSLCYTLQVSATDVNVYVRLEEGREGGREEGGAVLSRAWQKYLAKVV